MSTNYTEPQKAAIAKLRAKDGFTTTKYGNVATGINTTVLCSLQRMGVLKCSQVWARGVISADWELIETTEE